MIPVTNRFHGHGSLRYLFKNAQAVRSKLFTIRYTPNPHRKASRLAVIVSKKVHKSAVGRNRMRRRLYEILRQELPAFQGVFDIALIVTSAEVMSVEHDELRSTLQEILARAGIYTRS